MRYQMDLRSCCKLRLALALFCLTLLVEADRQYPLGIGLGAKYITAARFTKTEERMIIARIEGSARYQAYVKDSIACEGKRVMKYGEWFIQDSDNMVPAPPDTHNKDLAISIFTETLLAIKKAAANALSDSTLTIGGISRPSFFNSSSVQAVMDAAKAVEPAWSQPYQVMSPFHASRMAYKLNSCEGFGPDFRNCHIDDEDGHPVLLIEYEGRHLQFHLLHVVSEGVFVLGRARHEYLGANQQTYPGDAHYGRAQSALRKFMLDNDIGQAQAQAQDLGAIVISGQASTDSFNRFLRPMVREMMEQEGKEALTKDSIDPAYVTAVGAAYQAMLWAKQPELPDGMSCKTALPRLGHDEL